MSESAAAVEPEADPTLGEIVPANMTDLIRYPVSEQQIAELAKKFSAVTFDTPKNYEIGRRAIATMRELRLSVDRTRKDLNADSQAFVKRVNAVARHYTDLIEPIESELQAKKSAVDEEKERVKAELEAARLAEIEARLKAEREAEEAAAKALRDAEEQRIAALRVEQEAQAATLAAERADLERQRSEAEAVARAEREAREATDRAEREEREALARADAERVAAEQRAEAQRLAAEREKLKAEQDARDAENARQRAALDLELRAVEREKARLEAEKLAREAAERAERETRERIERERVEAQEAAVREAARLAEHAARLEALRPDMEKIAAWATELRRIRVPAVKDAAAAEAVSGAVLALEHIADELDLFAQGEGAAERSP